MKLPSLEKNSLLAKIWYWIIFFCSHPFLQAFDFPKDHSFHSDFKVEWCYFVGNLKTSEGKELGYELSFFKGIVGNKEEVFPVHFAISDVTSQMYHKAQILERKIGNLAGYSPQKIWSGDYLLTISSPTHFRILANPRDANIRLDLELSVDHVSQILIQGEKGISPKSRKFPGIYSYYYSIPRLKTKGKIWIDKKEHMIENSESWMDHEWSESLTNSQSSLSLNSSRNSWDWVCINLSDGTDLMFFNFRNDKNEESETFGTVRDSNGIVQYFFPEDKVLLFSPGTKIWKSEITKKAYKLDWKLQFPNSELYITERMENQEFLGFQTTGNSYWEGAVEISGIRNGKKVTGKGYLELKGH